MSEKGRGRIPLEDPITRAVRSPWLILISALVFLAWALSHFLLPEEKAFLGTPLSVEHDHLKDDCKACHQPGRGVPEFSCASEKCHLDTIQNNLHESLPTPCLACHPEHWYGKPIQKLMTDEACKACHDAIWRERGRPEESRVSRDIFSHRPHRKNYKCQTCHGTGEGTIKVPREKLFKMNTCTICHMETQCQLCHSYHDKKALPKPEIQESDTTPP
jgi:hypothetical protein